VSEEATTLNNDDAVNESQNETTASPEAAQELAHLEQRISDAKAKMQEYLDALVRERAEFANFRRRKEQELQESYQSATATALKQWLPVVDDFERALSTVPEELKGNPWVNGVMMVQRKLGKTLEDTGITPFDPLGEMFDPTRHEAVGTDSDGDAPSGQVTATLQKGYMMGDRVLRTAYVRVKS
jgi:molecular chaperone GrpE